ncbi:lactonohydrolase [Penicillium angulare]|uniref:Lactonohydrolase n=1 Tax=Penicillium angulare TaxID=116970 RepID=A0A9W9FV41_9EURO|nr:lactonohydrolase [Penicillium angulare]
MRVPYQGFLASSAAILSANSDNTPQQVPSKGPLVEPCGPSTSKIFCVNGYSAVLPGNFYRGPPPDSINPLDQPSYAQTKVPNDSSWSLLRDADFIVYDRGRALPILGDSPTSELKFNITPLFHDATVYDPFTNEIYFSQLSGGEISQKVIDLNENEPVVRRKQANPPLYSPTGGIYRNGLFYYCVGGSGSQVNGARDTVARPGIYTYNATSGESDVLLNNYFGYWFSTCNDIAMDGEGNIWFTDDDYSFGNGVSAHRPVLAPAVYRFNPNTGSVRIVDQRLKEPNGIAFSPDFKTLYVADSGAETVPEHAPAVGQVFYNPYNVTDPHVVWAFDVIRDGTALGNARPLHLTHKWLPDGLRVADNGYVLVGVGDGIDILSPEGDLILKIQTSFTAVGNTWAGPEARDIWITGVGGVQKVSINLPGGKVNGWPKSIVERMEL